MNKNNAAAGPPSASPPETVPLPRRRNTGSLAETPTDRDPTLKWCIPDPRGNREPTLPSANRSSASDPAVHGGNAVMPWASSLSDPLAEGRIKGALPEAIHDSTLDTTPQQGESFEILVADGLAEASESQPPGIREGMEAATPPPIPAALAVTPPPIREMEAATPQPVREMEAATPQPIRAALAATPPPIREAVAATPPPIREMAAATPPPIREAVAATPPPIREAVAATPPPIRETEVATPPPIREAPTATPPVRREMEAVTPPPKQETVTAIPSPKAVTAARLPEPAPATSPRPVAETGAVAEGPGEGVPTPASQASATTGAVPQAPIRMAETAEVGEGEFEVMESGDTPSRPTPAVLTPPPVPGIAGAPTSVSRSPGESPSKAGGSVAGGIAAVPVREALPLPEALSRRPLKKSLKPWFEEVFDEDYLRTLPFMTAQQTLRETAFIKEALSPPAEGEVLDIACGYGRHAIEFGQRGFRVTGLDLSLPLLIRAADEAQRRGLSVNFVHADMREMTYDSQFAAAYCVLTSFGYFDEETNLRVASSICRALKPGGRFLVDTINRDYIVSDFPSRVWWEGDGCVVLEEVDFDFHTSRVSIRRSIVFGDGRQGENEISIRAYSLHEMGRIFRRAGFQVLEVSGSLANKEPFLGAASRHVVLVCERPLT